VKLTGSNSAEIAAAPEAVHAVLVDFDGYHEWFPGAQESQLISAPGEAPTGRLLFGGHGVLPDVHCTLRYDTPEPGRLQPVSLGGELAVRGPGWRLTPQGPAHTLVAYEVELEMPVPGGFLGERALKGPATRYLIEEPVRRLKARVESRG
jgi:carbon monoxide dehydrogenase subunit G